MPERHLINEHLQALQDACGYAFQRTSLPTVALTHGSAGRNNNERLEFLGDAVLGSIVSEILFQRFPRQPEGFLSLHRDALVNGRKLAEIAQFLGLDKLLYASDAALNNNLLAQDSVLAGVLEAVVGAIYLDGGYAAASAFVRRIFAASLETLPNVPVKNPKTALQELLQARGHRPPYYQITVTTEARRGQPPCYLVECEAKDIGRSWTGRGASRKSAEELAARAALQELRR